MVDSDDAPPTYPPREPRIVAAGVTLVWMGVVAVIAIAADGSEPTVSAGAVVSALAMVVVIVNGIAGGFGRASTWCRTFAVTVSLLLATAVVVSSVVRWQGADLLYAPMVALVAGLLCWILAMLGWLAGSVARVALGREPDDQGIL